MQWTFDNNVFSVGKSDLPVPWGEKVHRWLSFLVKMMAAASGGDWPYFHPVPACFDIRDIF